MGLLLAQRLDRPFVDLDRAVEGRAGCSIRSLFAQGGEEAFRRLEAQTLRETLRLLPGAVIATGGGVVLRPENREALAGARVVYLDAPLEVLAGRVEADPQSEASRPALVPGGGLVETRALHEERDPLYRALAESVVDAAPELAAVVDAVVEALGGSS